MARWSTEFSESVGINTHFVQLDTYYATNFQEAKARLLDLGVRHIRDGAISNHGALTPADQSDKFRELGRAGIRADFIFEAGVSRNFVEAFPGRVDPAFEAYELPNEFNLSGGLGWAEKLRSWMDVFHGYVRSAAAIPSYPIVGPSLVATSPDPFASLGNQQDKFDLGNVHIYFDAYNPGTLGWGGPGPPPCRAFNYGSIDYITCLAAETSGHRPLMVTETGWSSNLSDPGGLSPELQAKYIARMLLLQFNRGTRRTYVYQLADAGGDSGQFHGLLTRDGREKPSFRELRSLLRLAEDSAETGGAGWLPARLDGQTAHVERTLLRRSDGSFRLILWVEQPGLDPRAKGSGHENLTVPPQQVTLTLTRYGVRRIMRLQTDGDLVTERLLFAKAGADMRVPLSLTDNLTVVDIAPPDD